jgi:hypothetical protein
MPLLLCITVSDGDQLWFFASHGCSWSRTQRIQVSISLMFFVFCFLVCVDAFGYVVCVDGVFCIHWSISSAFMHACTRKRLCANSRDCMLSNRACIPRFEKGQHARLELYTDRGTWDIYTHITFSSYVKVTIDASYALLAPFYHAFACIRPRCNNQLAMIHATVTMRM